MKLMLFRRARFFVVYWIQLNRCLWWGKEFFFRSDWLAVFVCWICKFILSCHFFQLVKGFFFVNFWRCVQSLISFLFFLLMSAATAFLSFCWFHNSICFSYSIYLWIESFFFLPFDDLLFLRDSNSIPSNKSIRRWFPFLSRSGNFYLTINCNMKTG